jgi:hypothetical protein
MRLGDTCQAELLPVGFEIDADHRDRTRREESPRRFSCCAARGPLQTAAAVQHRHDAGGQRPAMSGTVYLRPSKWLTIGLHIGPSLAPTSLKP